MADAKVLVLVPSLGDRLESLEKTLRSALDQRGTCDFTLTLVAPPAATEARELAARLGVGVVDDPRKGLSAALNVGIASATDEELLVWSGDDDLFRPGGFAALRAVLAADPHAPAAFGRCDYVDVEDRIVGVSRAGALAPRILAWGPNLVPQPAAMIRLSDLEAVGGYDESLRFTMDLDVFLKLRRRGPLLSVPVTTAAFRWHPDSLTVANREASTREAQAVRHRFLPPPARRVAFLWDEPLRIAARVAAAQVNRAARRAAAGAPAG